MSDELLHHLFPTDLHHVSGLHSEIKSHLPVQGRLLDLGCGSNREMARHRIAGREVWGADFQAHSALEHPEWFRLLGPSGKIPFPEGYFDVVTAVMVLEHVQHPALFLAEVARVLRPGGVFIGHTISGQHYVTWIRRLIGLMPPWVNQQLVKRLYGRPCEDTFPTYYRMNSARALSRLAEEAGLQMARVRRYADPGYFRFSRCLMNLAIRGDWWLEKWGAGLGRLYFTVVLRRPTVIRSNETAPRHEAQRPLVSA
ncbi:MAG: class I SAM-dependent methyltransferase [Gemmataceae bacterium]